MSNAHVVKDIILQITRLEEEFVGWLANYKSQVSGEDELYWPDPLFSEPSLSTSDGFGFRRLSEAVLLIYYWALRLVLNMNMATLCQDLPLILQKCTTDQRGVRLDSVFRFDLIRTFNTFHSSDKRVKLANNVIRVMPYLCREKVGMETMHGGLFPLGKYCPSNVSLSTLLTFSQKRSQCPNSPTTYRKKQNTNAEPRTLALSWARSKRPKTG